MRLGRILNAVSWQHAIGETLLIVVGVTLALAGTSWYENRQLRATEQEMLAQIRGDLIDKRALLEGRLQAHLDLASDIEQVIAFLDSDEQDASSMGSSFGRPGRFYGMRLNLAVYEVLKSRGLDLVSDDRLRIAVASFYEEAFPAVYEIYLNDRANSSELLVPYMHQHFRARGDNEWFPKNLDFIREDSFYRNFCLSRLDRIERFSLPTHEEAIAAIDAILPLLE